MKDLKLVIGGELVSGDDTMEVINPATEEIIGRCAKSGEAQANQAVAAAKAAFPSWARVPVGERQEKLARLADTIEQHLEELSRLLTLEQGKPLAQARYEVGGTAAIIRYFSAQGLPGEIIRETDDERIERQYSPLGVVVAITPWNAPLLLLALKLAPALLTGNTLVCKPAPTTPLTTLRLGELCIDIFPPGVLNIITDRDDLGDLITGHPDVAKVAFTGSTPTGKQVMRQAAGTIKRLTLELGGNDAAIVLDDVDVEAVAEALFMGAMVNAGQVCFAIKRLYVSSSHYEAMVAALARLAEGTVVGSGLEPDTQMGPLQNRKQYEKVVAYLNDARQHGQLVCGGEDTRMPGFFVRPAIVRDIDPDAALVVEEQFGPILPVVPYRDVDEAIRWTNDSPYGLSATVWSNDLEKASAVASQLEVGTVWINKHFDVPPYVPLGGAKQSGMGCELGREGIEEFLQMRIVNAAKKTRF